MQCRVVTNYGFRFTSAFMHCSDITIATLAVAVVITI